MNCPKCNSEYILKRVALAPASKILNVEMVEDNLS